jgi:hypothetical protein
MTVLAIDPAPQERSAMGRTHDAGVMKIVSK